MSRGRCLNCGATLEGPYCHDCGQPVKGMIRQFRSVVGDFLDTVFEYDSRIWRTLVPLYFQPGTITLDFIAGRRVRYVTPFRLTFVMLVVALLVLQVTVIEVKGVAPGAEPRISRAYTVEEVEAAREHALAELTQANAELAERDPDDPRAQSIDAGRRALDDAARRRIDWILAAEAARREGREVPPEPSPRTRIYLGDDAEAWDPVSNPVVVDWLPAFANAALNRWMERALVNAEAAEDDPDRFVDAFLGLLPVALFVLLPLFAALLKLCYLFSGRLYMEHMVVALHSHGFFGLALIVSTALQVAAQGLPAGWGVQTLVNLLLTLSLAWIPLYLLIMQRRVYAQGWLVTLGKFLLLGSVYLALLVLVVSTAAVVTLIRG